MSVIPNVDHRASPSGFENIQKVKAKVREQRIMQEGPLRAAKYIIYENYPDNQKKNLQASL